MRAAGFAIVGLILGGCMPPGGPPQNETDQYYYVPQPPPSETPPTAPHAPAPTHPTNSTTAPVNPRFHPPVTRPVEVPGGATTPSTPTPTASRTCAICGNAAEDSWTYCPADGARIPDPNAPAGDRGMRRIVYEYADGTQRFYDGENAARIHQIEGDLLMHFLGQGNANPYSGLKFKELSPKGKLVDGAINP